MTVRDCILAVDDNYQNLEILEEILCPEFSVVTARTGEEAIRLAPHLRPTLVLLDVMMPGIDGNETCRRLRALPELQDVKIVMLSARKELNDRLTAYKRGAIDYITKPFDDREVLAKVRAWMQMVHRRQVEEIWHEAERARETVGFAMVTLTGFRDTETGDHLFRMRWYAQALAEQMSVRGPYQDVIDEAFMQQLYRASPLHDIGKVGIDDAILRKPGPLTEHEFNAMKLHTIIGSDILSKAATRLPQVTYLKMAAEVARHHHERFDGKGYPDGIGGKDIPLAARIVSVADVFDALTSKRVYRKAFAVSEATQCIHQSKGSQFDPDVIAAFGQRQSEILQALTRFADGYVADTTGADIGAVSSGSTADVAIDHVEFDAEAHVLAQS